MEGIVMHEPRVSLCKARGKSSERPDLGSRWCCWPSSHDGDPGPNPPGGIHYHPSHGAWIAEQWDGATWLGWNRVGNQCEPVESER